MFRKLVAALLAVLVMTGCGSVTLSLDATDTGVIITAKNATSEDYVGVSFTVEEDSTVSAVPNLSKGMLNVVLKDTTGNMILNENFSGTEEGEYEIEAGDYILEVSALEKTTGTMELSAKK